MIAISENPDKKRFEALVEGKTAFVDYIRAKDAVYLTHTEVPTGLEGRGVGSNLVKGVLELLEEEGVRIAPLCPFVAAYIKRHPEWKRVLAPNYNV
ncbi:MAG: GNAT family N-acetyltransferase [Bacteroidota bacterium]